MVGPLFSVETTPAQDSGLSARRPRAKSNTTERDAPLVEREQITLVDQQQAPPLAALSALGRRHPALAVERVNVLLEVRRPERVGISGVDNLDDEVRALDDSPELTPDLEITLERGQEEVVDVGQPKERAKKA